MKNGIVAFYADYEWSASEKWSKLNGSNVWKKKLRRNAYMQIR